MTNSDSWRFIDLSVNTCYMNMAIDEALMILNSKNKLLEINWLFNPPSLILITPSSLIYLVIPAPIIINIKDRCKNKMGSFFT